MTERTCSMDGCERPHRSRELCALHYYRWQRSGKPWPDLVARVCKNCDAQFQPASCRQLYCDPKCSQAAYRKSRALGAQVPTRKCDQCTTVFVALPGNRLRCSEACSRRAEGRPPDPSALHHCPQCQGPFQRRGTRAKYCSRICASRAKGRRRTGRQKIRRELILSRDSWTCQICAGPIQPGLRYPHPEAATVDHIVPVCLGGTNDTENLQAAHMRCNSVKGARLWA